jgi:hypothetical protein
MNILYLENEETKDADDSPSTVLLDYPLFSKERWRKYLGKFQIYQRIFKSSILNHGKSKTVATSSSNGI